jgi:iron complex transport system substrate-binding protein
LGTELPVSPTLPGTTVSTPGETAGSGEVVVITTDGSTVVLPHPAQRIIAANGDAAELLIALGATDRIVGVTGTVATDPVLAPYVNGTRSIGDWQTPDIEAMLSLHPDVVITYGSYRPKNIDRILAANIMVLSIDCYRLDTLSRDTRSLANLTGTQSSAESLITFIESNTDIVKDRVAQIAPEKKPRVYIESYTEYTASGYGSAADMLVNASGGNNIAGMESLASFKVNPEWVVTQNPDVIIKLISSTKGWDEYPAIREAMIARTGFANISAVREGRVYLLNSDYAFGPRVSAGMLAVSKTLHPDLFTDVNPDAIVAQYKQQFLGSVLEGQILYPA